MQNTRSSPPHDDRLVTLAEQLSHNSLPYRDPLAVIDWTALSTGDAWLPPEMLSLHGVAEFDALPEQQRRDLSVAEFVHFAQGGLWLEALFMERLAQAMQGDSHGLTRQLYQLHELREEAGHSLMFCETIRHSGLNPARSPYSRLRLAGWLARHVSFASPLFWSTVLLGEEVADRFSRALRQQQVAVNPAIYQLVSIHLVDEARHIAHAREVVGCAMADMPAWRRKLLQRITAGLFRRFVQIFYYPPVQTYELAGLSQPRQWRQLALSNPQRQAFVTAQLRSIHKVAHDAGIFP